ncbi:hypothetical protein BD410DRAFT_839694 [Rickenella mellea]|uniref:DUF6593 domain-containing protein n=1 Tax=Rickenella mellea TaxID=50990 RepID=A0A4Y7Q600_9AGAM|nr:hypothetical protein BD410DRAFT_839694 [Rickenella mellea]
MDQQEDMILTLLKENVLNTEVVGSERQPIYKVETPSKGRGDLITTVTRTDEKPERVVATIDWAGSSSTIVDFNNTKISLTDFLGKGRNAIGFLSTSRLLKDGNDVYTWKTIGSNPLKLHDSNDNVVAKFHRPESIIFRKAKDGYLELSNSVAAGSLDAVFVSFIILKHAQQRKAALRAQTINRGGVM